MAVQYNLWLLELVFLGLEKEEVDVYSFVLDYLCLVEVEVKWMEF